MIEFDTIDEMLTHNSKCPLCSKTLTKLFATGKYEDITNFGHKDKTETFSATKAKLKLHRSFEIDSVPIHIEYVVDTKTNKFIVNFEPSADEIVEKLPIAAGFYELDEKRFRIGMENGLINIFKVLNRSLAPFFFIQQCEGHFKRIGIMEMNDDGDMFQEMFTYDEYHYIPTFKVDDELYCIHDHCSPVSKNMRVVFIQKVKKETPDDIDPKRGGIYLWEKSGDIDLMNFDFSDVKKLARRVGALHALRG